MRRMFEKYKMLLLGSLFTLMMSVSAFAADEFDMTAAITTSVGDMKTQVMAIIGICVGAVLAIVGAKLAISKGISVFKAITNKG